MDILSILVGIAVLTLGRKLFWLFVGAAGFVAGLTLAALFVRGQPDWVLLAIALVAGLVGVLVAHFLQQLAVFVAGFIAGGYIFTEFLPMVGWEPGWPGWVIFLVGGVFGGVLLAALFDWALIFLSSLTGATIIVQATQFSPQITTALFVVLLIVGVAIQISLMQGERSSSTRAAKTKQG